MSKADYDIVIGLEIHAELNTNTKIFCGCKNKFGQAPNTCCCAGCLSLPGTLPVLNKKAVELTIKAGLTVDSKINDYAIFERDSVRQKEEIDKDLLGEELESNELISRITVQLNKDVSLDDDI